jgi:very-short-patch-repair endonuclease
VSKTYREYPHLIRATKSLRRRQTFAEKVLWNNLRSRKLRGYKFVRQYPVAGYVVDFYCHERRLAIEVDGGIHMEKEIWERDAFRTKILEQQGLQVVRFSNEDVLARTSDVLLMINDVLSPFSVERRG